MSNTIKKLFKEEISLYELKSYSKDKDNAFITDVLGIKTINETYSLEVRKLILEETIIYENFMGSIKQLLGKAYDNVYTTVKDFYSLAGFLKEIFKDKELFREAFEEAKTYAEEVFNKLGQKLERIGTKIVKQSEVIFKKINGLVASLKKLLNRVIGNGGWKDLLKIIGFVFYIKTIDEHIILRAIEGSIDFINDNAFQQISKIMSTFKTYAIKVLRIDDVQSLIDIIKMVPEVIKQFTGISISVVALLLIINEMFKDVRERIKERHERQDLKSLNGEEPDKDRGGFEPEKNPVQQATTPKKQAPAPTPSPVHDTPERRAQKPQMAEEDNPYTAWINRDASRDAFTSSFKLDKMRNDALNYAKLHGISTYNVNSLNRNVSHDRDRRW